MSGSTWEHVDFRRLDDVIGLAGRIAGEVREAIIDGRLPPDERLHEERLAASFGTSRTPVREAMRILEADGLVSLIPRHGACVRSLGIYEIADLTVSRAYLYGLAALLCSVRRTADDLTELERLVNDMKTKVAESELKEYLAVITSFNDALVRVSGNGTLSGLLRPLMYPSLRLRYALVQVPGRFGRSVGYYGDVIDGVRLGDGAVAERAMRRVIAESGKALLEHNFGLGPEDEPVKVLELVGG